MPYEWKRAAKKGGGYRLSRVEVKAPKGAVTIEPAQPATVAKVDVDSGETVAVEPTVVAKAAVPVATTPKSTTRKKKS